MTREEAIEVIKAKADYLESDKRFRAAVETIIPELRESEDERIRKEIVDFIRWAIDRGSITKEQREKSDTWFSYLEKQKEYVSNNFDDVWDEEDCEEIIAEGQKLTPRFKELLKEVCHAWYDRGAKLEKQKEASKAIEAVERIDKYIDEHVENAHDMKDSHPDKKYCQGIDDTLAGIAGILQDVYSNEKQKEQKPKKDIVSSDAVESCMLRYLQSAANRKDDIEIIEDTKAYKSELISIIEKEQKSAKWSEEDSDNLERVDNYLWMLDNYVGDDCATPQAKADKIRGNIQEVLSPWLKSLPERFNLQPKQEWSEKDERMIERLITWLTWFTYNTRTDSTSPNITFFDEINWLKSLRHQPKIEWGEVDEEIIYSLRSFLIQAEQSGEYGSIQIAQIKRCLNWLNSLSLNLKKKNEDVAKLCSNEWNEEDENIFNDILVDMADRREMFKSNGEIEFAEDTQKKIDWLSSHLSNFQSSYPQQKSAEWSEEDKQMLLTVICDLKRHDNDAYVAEIKWLNCLDERFSPQPKQEWSEDYDEENLQTRFAFYTYKDNPTVLYLSNVFVEETSRNHGFGTRILKAAEKVAETIGATAIRLKVKQDSPANTWYRKNGYVYMAFEDGYDWLEKNLKYMKSNKQEWSEEDEEMLVRLLDSISIGNNYQEMRNWLLLKLKSLLSQYHGDVTMTEAYKMGKEAGEASHWKPTEHQMTILKAVKEYVGKGSGYWGEGLGSLIDDLEKL